MDLPLSRHVTSFADCGCGTCARWRGGPAVSNATYTMEPKPVALLGPMLIGVVACTTLYVGESGASCNCPGQSWRTNIFEGLAVVGLL